MSACEKCWRDSGGDAVEYEKLVTERNCSPEKRAGDGADMCPFCKRTSVHIYTDVCMACGRQT